MNSNTHTSITVLLLIVIAFSFSCKPEYSPPAKENAKPLNILWLVAEDLSPYIPSFGDSTVQTPNLSRLAAEGIRYTNVYSISGVCSPSRAAIATGMYPSGVGAHHMRTLFQQPAAKEMGVINYECVLPPEVKMVSQIMRENGYYCTNNSKKDYQFHPGRMAWDESSIYAHWRNRPEEKPFYSVFNFNVTHESNMWNIAYKPYDIKNFPPERNNPDWRKELKEKEKPLFVEEDLKVNIPPYLPETDLVKKDVRRMYSNIIEMDKHVGRILKQLEDDGLLDHTIIVWYTDHGGPLPRQKRLLYDSGLNVPMIIRYPDQRKAGEIDDQLISFIDFAPTLLSMASVKPPEYIQGKAFAGAYKVSSKRKYIHAAADRFDEKYDRIRAVRDQRFKYLKNFNTNQGYYLPLAYREKMATMQELLRLREEGKLNEIQKLWFRDSKPEEELFDTQNDPHELNNLAADPAYVEKLKELKNECTRWMKEIDDKGHIPEVELINQFWPNKIQPVTATPVVKKKKGKIEISCSTPGATVGYKFPSEEVKWIGWNIYNQAIELSEDESIKVFAHRIGYAPSDTLEIQY